MIPVKGGSRNKKEKTRKQRSVVTREGIDVRVMKMRMKMMGMVMKALTLKRVS